MWFPIKKMLADKHLWMMTLIYLCYTTGSWLYHLVANHFKKSDEMSLTNVGWLSTLPFIMALGGLYILARCRINPHRRLYTAISIGGLRSFSRAQPLSGANLVFVLVISCHRWLLLNPCKVLLGHATRLFASGLSGGARGFINVLATWAVLRDRPWLVWSPA